MCFALLLLLLFVFRIVEPAYMMIFHKPLYIHFYLFPKKLTVNQKQILEKEFSFYRRLTQKKKIYFEHRVATFIKQYPFIGKEEILVTDEMRIIIAATYVLLTFGMRKYLIGLFNKIILYPTAYFSTVNQEYHKGEFNPIMKAVAFSWEDFILGHKTANDNLNLGLHEFSHIIHFYGLRSNDPSAIIFYDQYYKVITYYDDVTLNKKLSEQGYFREYAYENRFEFIAVMLEHFFETPQLFKIKYPKLYQDVCLMINYNEKNQNDL
jgi:Mlc titration factor MtfA (ptsG expression regulator)